MLLADSYIAQGNDSDAELMLQTVLDGKPKQEYIDEANAKLQSIKTKREATQLQNQAPNNNLKIEFKTSDSDKDLFDQLYEAQQESIQKKQ